MNVTCATCLREYPGIGPDPEKYKQGEDCAASVLSVDGDVRLVGHFGSKRHDMDVFRVVQGRMSAATFAVGTDPICDDCIDLAAMRGDLLYLGEGQCDSPGRLLMRADAERAGRSS